MALFPEEKQLMESLIDEWYEVIKKVTTEADGIFSEKGRMYDVNDPVWTRAEWPVGFIHELTKKSNRVKQLMSGVTEVNGLNIKRIIEANEELGDIQNYSRMMHALNLMLIHRWDGEKHVGVDFQGSTACGYCGKAECGCIEDVECETPREYATRMLKGHPAPGQIQPGEKRVIGNEEEEIPF